MPKSDKLANPGPVTPGMEKSEKSKKKRKLNTTSQPSESQTEFPTVASSSSVMSTPTPSGAPKAPWYGVVRDGTTQKEPVYIDAATGAVLEGSSKDRAIRADQNVNPRKRKKSKATPRKEPSPQPSIDVQIDINPEALEEVAAAVDAASQKEVRKNKITAAIMKDREEERVRNLTSSQPTPSVSIPLPNSTQQEPSVPMSQTAMKGEEGEDAEMAEVEEEEEAADPESGSDSESDSDSDSEIEFEEVVRRKPVNESGPSGSMDKRPPRDAQKPKQDRPKFETLDAHPKALYWDHNVPLKGVEENKEEKLQEKGTQIYVATYGRHGNPIKMKAIINVMKTIAGEEVMNGAIIEALPKSPWHLITFQNKSDAKKRVKALLKMGTVVQNYPGKTAVFFREVGRKPGLLRIYHLLDTPNSGPVEEAIIKAFRVLAPTASIKVERQGEKGGIPTNAHMVYVTRPTKKDNWTEPTSPLELEFEGKKVKWKVKRSKPCYLCHSEDHLDDVCPWKMGNWNLQSSFGEKLKQRGAAPTGANSIPVVKAATPIVPPGGPS